MKGMNWLYPYSLFWNNWDPHEESKTNGNCPARTDQYSYPPCSGRNLQFSGVLIFMYLCKDFHLKFGLLNYLSCVRTQAVRSLYVYTRTPMSWHCMCVWWNPTNSSPEEVSNTAWNCTTIISVEFTAFYKHRFIYLHTYHTSCHVLLWI
jgi:hypothetical protein